MFRTPSYRCLQLGHFVAPPVWSKRFYSSSLPFKTPQPPSLPPKEQKEWEESMKQQHPIPYNQESESPTPSSDRDLHPDARKPIFPDFEGDTNPITGEVGGPKKEPLTWGANGEWTYGGRATDF